MLRKPGEGPSPSSSARIPFAVCGCDLKGWVATATAAAAACTPGVHLVEVLVPTTYQRGGSGWEEKDRGGGRWLERGYC